MDESRLYFIAIVPPPAISERINLLKTEFAKKYQCNHALKVIPHITLLQPFKRFPTAEVELHLSLKYFFSKYNSLAINLSGFGCFEKKSKVIFIAVDPNDYLNQMHSELMVFLRKEHKFSERETSLLFHPHISIAFRDLTGENFNKAFPFYKEKEFKATFSVNNIGLFKHNFRQWELLGQFPLNLK